VAAQSRDDGGEEIEGQADGAGTKAEEPVENAEKRIMKHGEINLLIFLGSCNFEFQSALRMNTNFVKEGFRDAESRDGEFGGGELGYGEFVSRGSIVRKIWGSSDTVLLVFAGSAAEFALNRSVDWLYYTGRLPADPIGRLFSTVRYAREIIFSSAEKALGAIDQITAIHGRVEKSRNMKIPDNAYRDVLFMLIDYTIRSFELLERKLTAAERGEVFDVFLRVGARMGLRGLPENYEIWALMREDHLQRDLVYSGFTKDLYGRYRKSLGFIRYRILLGGQALLAPERVKRLLGLRGGNWMKVVVTGYTFARFIRLDRAVKSIVLPAAYRAQVAALDVRD
jgi:ER-bound oxygenase mpaB/B'/Rubber oxygenase, catalytic domain